MKHLCRDIEFRKFKKMQRDLIPSEIEPDPLSYEDGDQPIAPQRHVIDFS